MATERITFSGEGTLSGNTLSGVAHAFGQRTKHGAGYIEFAPGSFDAALKRSDVVAFWNHNTDMPLGRQSAGTVRLKATPEGLAYEIDLPPVSYAEDAKVLIGSRVVTSMSFGIIPGAVESLRAKDGRQVQRHTQVAEIFDISPTALPAFKGTSVALHSAGSETPRSQLARARHRVLVAR